MISYARRVRGLRGSELVLLSPLLLTLSSQASFAQTADEGPSAHASEAPPSDSGQYMEQPRTSPESQPIQAAPVPYALGVTLATSLESEPGSTSAVFSPLLEGAYAVDPQVRLDLSWGFAWAVDGQGLGESTARAGNPMLSGSFHRNDGSWRWAAGVGFTAPLAHFPLGPDGRTYAFVYNQTLAMWGMWNQWLWSVDRMAVPVLGRAALALPNDRTLVAEAAIAAVWGARAGASGKEIVGQVAVEVVFPIDGKFALCPRVQTVLLPSVSVDRWQSAAGVRATMQTRHGRYFAGVLLNLDEPLGVFRGLERWGLLLGKEADL
jgi:hypothetical protein